MEQNMNKDIMIQKCWEILNNPQVKIEKPRYNICDVYLNNKKMFSVAETMLFIKDGHFTCQEASKMYAKCEELFKPTRNSAIQECLKISDDPNIIVRKIGSLYYVYLGNKEMFVVCDRLLFTKKGEFEYSGPIFEKCKELYEPTRIATEQQQKKQEEKDREEALKWFEGVQLTPRQTFAQKARNWFSRQRN